jgi:hypothetical protein
MKLKKVLGLELKQIIILNIQLELEIIIIKKIITLDKKKAKLRDITGYYEKRKPNNNK